MALGKGVVTGFNPMLVGSTTSWALYFWYCLPLPLLLVGLYIPNKE
jgi:hypothetical protein